MAAPDTERPSHAELLSAFLATHDAACPVYTYSLRDLAAERCPECGAPLELRVASPQLRTGPWLLALVSFALALGFDGVVAVLMMVGLAVNPPAIWHPYGLLGVLLFLAAVMLASLVAATRERGVWNRWPRRRQWITSVSLFVGVGVLHALVGASLLFIID